MEKKQPLMQLTELTISKDTDTHTNISQVVLEGWNLNSKVIVGAVGPTCGSYLLKQDWQMKIGSNNHSEGECTNISTKQYTQ